MKINQCDVKSSRNESVFIVAQSLTATMDFYWVAFTTFKNILEDVEGADGRIEYVVSLRYKLIEVLQEMDASLSKARLGVRQEQRLPFALGHGIDFLGIGGDELIHHLRLHENNLSYEDIQKCLLIFGDFVIRNLPGKLPNAQGSVGRREVLQAMRRWSNASDATGDDMGFLSSRLHDL
jgi:hypothetical protein